MNAPPEPIPEGLILPHVEALIGATSANFRIGGGEAFYSPTHDVVQVPRPHAFFEPINWHRTASAGRAAEPGRSQRPWRRHPGFHGDPL